MPAADNRRLMPFYHAFTPFFFATFADICWLMLFMPHMLIDEADIARYALAYCRCRIIKCHFIFISAFSAFASALIR